MNNRIIVTLTTALTLFVAAYSAGSQTPRTNVNPGTAGSASRKNSPEAGSRGNRTNKKTAGPDLAKEPTLYVVGYAHLDTEWRWE
ncbi:MAG: hypothetical protein ACXW3C_19045 [Pyrinomonadaceae bacterium]